MRRAWVSIVSCCVHAVLIVGSHALTYATSDDKLTIATLQIFSDGLVYLMAEEDGRTLRLAV